MVIPLLRPSCTEDELRAVTDVLKSGWWGLGPVCKAVETRLSELYPEYPYCVTTNSATAALHMAMLVNNIGPGDEVIVPALTFVSTALAVSYVGATPVFADVDRDTLCLSVETVREKITPRTRAVIFVDYAGYPALVQRGEFDFPIIQDAAHSCGGVGYGDQVCFSFHAVKNIATGDGGAILLKDREMAERVRALCWCGINKSTWERAEKKYGWDYSIEEIGYKCHWNDIQASIALTQLRRMPALLGKRAEIASLYAQGLRDVCQLPEKHARHTWHLFPIRVAAERRDSVISYLIERGISAGVHYKPLTYYSMYADQPTPPVTDSEWRRLISLPIFYDLSIDEQAQIILDLKQLGSLR